MREDGSWEVEGFCESSVIIVFVDILISFFFVLLKFVFVFWCLFLNFNF